MTGTTAPCWMGQTGGIDVAFRNTHEGIVTQEEFDRANANMRSVVPGKKNKMVRLMYGWWPDEQLSDEVKRYVESRLDRLGGMWC